MSTAQCSPAEPHHRHQSSLEGVIDLCAATPPLSPEERQDWTRVFTAVIEACEPLQDPKPYKPITLVRLTYEYARSETSKDNFLRFFFRHTEISSDVSPSESTPASEHVPRLVDFAQTLFENFFLPLRATTRKTPQPSPAILSDAQSVHTITGTTDRLAALRGECLIRDHYRCVISRTFDDREMIKRVSRDGEDNAQDDEGSFLVKERGTFTALEVAHIIPHSLVTLPSGKTELNESKKLALAILNMFDDGVVHLIEGVNIDRSRNAITLTNHFHHLFGGFEVYFEATENEPHAYRIDTTRTGIARHPLFPVDRTLFLSDTRTIDPPSPRLLAIHAAIAKILHMSAAGRYIDSILYDLDKGGISVDGSTPLGHFTALRIHGWVDGRIRVC